MRSIRRYALVLVTLFALMTTATTAHADDRPLEERVAAREGAARPISIAPLAGFASERYRFGFGLRAGYTIPSGTRSGGGAYLGAAFMAHFGSSTNADALGSSFGSSFSAYYPAGEIGYDIRRARLVIRPYAAMGLVVSTVTRGVASATYESTTNRVLAFYPGCTLTYDFPGAPVFAGGDARVLVLADGGGPSFGLFGTGGFRF